MTGSDGDLRNVVLEGLGSSVKLLVYGTENYRWLRSGLGRMTEEWVYRGLTEGTGRGAGE